MQYKAIRADKYLDQFEIEQHLENVEYIVMAAPAPEKFAATPIHFTFFLNTQENLPREIQEAVLEKFLDDNGIGKPAELLSQLMPVGFATGSEDTAMPMLLVKPQDQSTIPHTVMFVMDFLADSKNFEEAKVKNLTGWSYSYNS
jgi:hypothetical protein